MIKKIISSGQSGIDRAALDFALEVSIAHGGWISGGRQTETGRLPDKYHLTEIRSLDDSKITELNVVDSDGTLIISRGELTGGSAESKRFAQKHRKPCIHIDLDIVTYFKAAEIICSWVNAGGIEIINITGPGPCRDPEIYDGTKKLLKTVLHLHMTDKNMHDPYRLAPNLPQSLEEAVEKLLSEMSFKDKTEIARMDEKALTHLQPTLGEHIRNKFWLLLGNDALLKSCRAARGNNDLDASDVAAIIIEKLWRRLKKTHALRVVS